MNYFFAFLVAIAVGVGSGWAIAVYGEENTSPQRPSVQASRYQVSGDRRGLVTVSDLALDKVIRTFQMDPGVVVRETFLLDNGRTVAASQKDHAVFWDLATGREIRRFPQRIYGFSPDETKFFTYEDKGLVLLYAYPNMAPICKLIEDIEGPGAFQFSPNGRFLVIIFRTGMPSTDESYPYPRRDNYWRSSISVKLFNLQACQEVQEFYALRIYSFGEFSQSSKFYYLKDMSIDTNPGHETGSWEFDLETYQIRRIAD